MLIFVFSQFMVLDGGILEEDNQICHSEFSKFAGSFPEEIFSKGFEFDVLNYFKVENWDKIKRSIFLKASDNKFLRIIKSDEIEVYIDPESRMRVQVDSLVIFLFTRYLAVRYLKDHVCIYSFRPKKEDKK
jgi:hypothetical protein